MANQLEFYAEKLGELLKPEPYIADLRKFFFGSSDTIITPLNGGLSEEEAAFSEVLKENPNAVFDYGSAVKNVVHDPQTENPTSYFDAGEKTKLLESPKGNFYFEKYLCKNRVHVCRNYKPALLIRLFC